MDRLVKGREIDAVPVDLPDIQLLLDLLDMLRGDAIRRAPRPRRGMAMLQSDPVSDIRHAVARGRAGAAAGPATYHVGQRLPMRAGDQSHDSAWRGGRAAVILAAGRVRERPAGRTGRQAVLTWPAERLATTPPTPDGDARLTHLPEATDVALDVAGHAFVCVGGEQGQRHRGRRASD